MVYLSLDIPTPPPPQLMFGNSYKQELLIKAILHVKLLRVVIGVEQHHPLVRVLSTQLATILHVKFISSCRNDIATGN